MDILDMKGANLGQVQIIDLYLKARKLAPPRFLTMRLHPDTWNKMQNEAEPTHVIQYGDTPGPLGKKVVRIACVKPPSGVADGLAVVQDDKLELGEIVIEIHGIPELIWKGFKCS